MKLLIVDDEKHVVEGLKNIMPWQELGFDDVETALDGEEAWEKFRHEAPDFVITDIYMPRMNGLELIKEIRAVNKNIPIVILSGYDEFEYAKEAIHLGVSKYILKPAVYTEIIEVIKQCLHEMEAADKQQRYLDEYRRQLDTNLPVLRKHFLFEMITFGLRKKDASAERLQFYGLDDAVVSGGLVMSLIIHRTDTDKTEAERDWQLLKFAVSNIAAEIADDYKDTHVLQYMEDRLPIVLFGAEEEEVISRARSIAQKLMESIAQYLELDTNVGIGRWYKELEQYPLSEQESRDVLSLSDFEGFQRAFFAGMDPDRRASEQWTHFPARQLRKLLPVFMQVDRTRLKTEWRLLEQTLLEASDVPVSYLQTVCIGILCGLQLHLGIDEETGPSVAAALSLQHVPRPDDHAQLARWMGERLHALLDRLENPEHVHGARKYVDYVKNVVHERYRENISFAEIARELHLTRNYLSNLFKRETGESFTNYLTGYRIRKAKELMDVKQYMIYEICEMVGYSDPAYFSRMFKNFTGVSPSEYMMGADGKKDT